MEPLLSTARALPAAVKQDPRGFAMSCIVPDLMVGALIGRGGSNTKEIQAKTGAKIKIEDIPEDPENKTMKISGPIMAICAAYMEMMSSYISAEASVANKASNQGKGASKGGFGGDAGFGGDGYDHIEDQISMMQQQLYDSGAM